MSRSAEPWVLSEILSFKQELHELLGSKANRQPSADVEEPHMTVTRVSGRSDETFCGTLGP